MNVVEAEGRTIEEAVAAALQQLQAQREQVEIEILAQATKGFLGIGGKKARVRATLRVPLTIDVGSEPTPARQRTERRAAEAISAEPALEPIAESAPPSRELAEHAGQVLREVVRLMGIEVPLSLDIREEEIVLNIENTAGGLLIGRKGQTLDALEYILNRIITRSEEGETHIVLDAEGYRERRRKSLESLALRLGERAKRRRKMVTLSPLNPRDRRIIHLALEGDPLVTTKSMGRGYFRRLCIIPEEGSRRERSRGASRVQAAE